MFDWHPIHKQIFYEKQSYFFVTTFHMLSLYYFKLHTHKDVMLFFAYRTTFFRHKGFRELKRLKSFRLFQSPNLSSWGVKDVANVSRCWFVLLAEGQCVGIQSTLDGLSLGPGQCGQQQCIVYIFAVLADEVRQTSISQPLLLLFTFWVTQTTGMERPTAATRNEWNSI